MGISEARGIVLMHMLSEITHQARWGLAEGLIGYCIKEGIRIT